MEAAHWLAGSMRAVAVVPAGHYTQHRGLVQLAVHLAEHRHSCHGMAAAPAAVHMEGSSAVKVVRMAVVVATAAAHPAVVHTDCNQPAVL